MFSSNKINFDSVAINPEYSRIIKPSIYQPYKFSPINMQHYSDIHHFEQFYLLERRHSCICAALQIAKATCVSYRLRSRNDDDTKGFWRHLSDKKLDFQTFIYLCDWPLRLYYNPKIEALRQKQARNKRTINQCYN